jgi:hypothetical protein
MEEKNQNENSNDYNIQEKSLNCSGISSQILHVSSENFSKLQTN